VTEGGGERKLEEIKNVREYQFTLRNTSTVHLQDVEIQFEFPTSDVEAWAERPALSKTAPVTVEAAVTEPWKRGYRWRIPQFPSTDSIEFTFRAVDPTTDNYEVALYHSERVVIERSSGQGEKKSNQTTRYRHLLLLTASATFLAVFAVEFSDRSGYGKKVSAVNQGGCTLAIESTFSPINPDGLPWKGPWQLNYRVSNIGTQRCFVQSTHLPDAKTPLEPGGDLFHFAYSETRPQMIQADFLIGPNSPTNKVSVPTYVGTLP
jgi:hypothetical protein